MSKQSEDTAALLNRFVVGRCGKLFSRCNKSFLPFTIPGALRFLRACGEENGVAYRVLQLEETLSSFVFELPICHNGAQTTSSLDMIHVQVEEQMCVCICFWLTFSLSVCSIVLSVSLVDFQFRSTSYSTSFSTFAATFIDPTSNTSIGENIPLRSMRDFESILRG